MRKLSQRGHNSGPSVFFKVTSQAIPGRLHEGVRNGYQDKHQPFLPQGAHRRPCHENQSCHRETLKQQILSQEVDTGLS